MRQRCLNIDDPCQEALYGSCASYLDFHVETSASRVHTKPLRKSSSAVWSHSTVTSGPGVLSVHPAIAAAAGRQGAARRAPAPAVAPKAWLALTGLLRGPALAPTRARPRSAGRLSRGAPVLPEPQPQPALPSPTLPPQRRPPSQAPESAGCGR